MFLPPPPQQQQTPTPPIPSNEYSTPLLSNKTIKKQPRVNLPKVMDDDHNLLKSQQLHVETSEVDISDSNESIVTPTADILHQESNSGIYLLKSTNIVCINICICIFYHSN